MKIAYNSAKDIAYISLQNPADGVPSVASFKQFAHGVIDYDAEGRMVGVEVHGFAKLLSQGTLTIPTEPNP